MSMGSKDSLNKKNKKYFLLLRNKISELLNDVPNFNCSLEDLNHFMKKNEKLWGMIITKFPVLKFTDNQRKFIKTLEI